MPTLPAQSCVPETRLTLLSPAPVAFSCSRRDARDGSAHLVLAGELDLAARSDLTQALDDAQADSDRVILDLSALTLIDSAGLSVLFAAAEPSDRGAAGLILRNPRGQVSRMLDLIGPPDGVVVSDDTDAAEGSERRAAA